MQDALQLSKKINIPNPGDMLAKRQNRSFYNKVLSAPLDKLGDQELFPWMVHCLITEKDVVRAAKVCRLLRGNEKKFPDTGQVYEWAILEASRFIYITNKKQLEFNEYKNTEKEIVSILRESMQEALNARDALIESLSRMVCAGTYKIKTCWISALEKNKWE